MVVDPGQWVDHPDPSYMGEYEMTLDCPDWAHDYDCRRPSNPELISPDFIKAQYRCAALHTAAHANHCPLQVSWEGWLLRTPAQCTTSCSWPNPATS